MSSETKPENGSTTPGTLSQAKANDMELTMENGLLPVLGIFCASVILLVATVNSTSDMTASMEGYANSLASISMVVSFLILARIRQLEKISLHIPVTVADKPGTEREDLKGASAPASQQSSAAASGKTDVPGSTKRRSENRHSA